MIRVHCFICQHQFCEMSQNKIIRLVKRKKKTLNEGTLLSLK